MGRFQSFGRFLFFWERRNHFQNRENKPLIPKGDVNNAEGTSAVSYLATHDSSGSQTSSTLSSHEESRASSKNVFSSRALSPSSWRDYILKCLLVTSNLLFTVLGLVTLVVGLWGLINKESFAQEKISGIGTDPMLLFTFLGFILALLSLMGCVGALRENMCLLRNFSAVVLVLVVAQVLAVVVLYSLQGQIEDYLHSGMLAAMVRYQDDLDLRFITDEIQTGLQCCGADTYRDWGINVYFNCSAPGVQACGVPPSCCIDPLENGTVWNSQCGVGAQKLDEFSAQSVIFLGGCMGSISRWIEQHSGVIVTVVIILLGVQILTMFITAHLLLKIRWSRAQHAVYLQSLQ
ncbi:tetraspanin-10 [Sinocyclocheilus anshuiensis]|uniref:tetraspanin-10 n=1 Tax=Sinocyclocheilus anshuiensis TaxID=1608454 RepID=UPI0007B8CADA|nr:PREDICTED: tetraspanin-10-like [Sinocyclocheilus anshuiensis]